MQEKAAEMHREITHIQNTVWAMYKDFLEDHDMKAYNRKTGELAKEYRDKGNSCLLTFCQWTLITWAPVINGLAECFRERQE